MSTESIIKIKKRVNPYTMIDSSIFLNNKISWKAKGLMGYFLSRPDDWKIHLKDLYKQSTDGYDSVKSGLKELKKHGYLELVPIRKKGKIVSWEYIVYEIPITTPPGTGESEPQEGFPLVEKPPEEKPLKDNPRYTNNDRTNNNYTNDIDNDRYDLLIKKYKDIIEKCRLYVFDDNISKLTEEAIKSLYFDEDFTIKNLSLPIPLVRDTLEKINPLIVENAVSKMKNSIANGTIINSTKHYLMSCIFNSITEYTSKQLAENEIYKPIKSIFDIARGTEFEEPVNILSNSFSEIVFNTFFRDKITDICLKNGTLTFFTTSDYIASALTKNYSDKVKECFKQLNISKVLFLSNLERSVLNAQ